MDPTIVHGTQDHYDALRKLVEVQRARERIFDRESFCRMIKRVAPWFQIEEVHLVLGGYLEAIVDLVIRELMVFEPPRAGKSTQGSVFFPAFWLGRYPKDKVLQVGHSAAFATDFGRQTKNLMQEQGYVDLYPLSRIDRYNRSARRWATSAGGHYYAAGQRSPIAGRGYNLGLWDDLLSEQDRDSTSAKQRIQAWMGPGFFSRRQPERNVHVSFQTRWATDDPGGYLLSEYPGRYTVLKVPAFIDEETAEIFNEVTGDPLIDGDPIKFKAGDSFCPRRHPKSGLLELQESVSERDWAALWMQEPIEEGGNIYKRPWWRQWSGRIPKFEAVFQTYDTAFTEEEIKKGSFSARTTWGVFWYEPTPPTEEEVLEERPLEKPGYRLFLLDHYEERVGFPDLRKEMKESASFWSPDWLAIEKKASGQSLIQEAKRIPGLRVLAFSPSNKSKTARASVASVVLESRLVFYPGGRTWTDKVINHCAEFPRGEADDIADTVTMAFIIFRRHWIRRLPLEDDSADWVAEPPRRRGYGNSAQ